MAEIECRELFGGDRLVVYRNPLLAEERTRKRKDLIAGTAADLMDIRRDKRPLRNADAIRRRVERALKKHKMRKHFDLKIGTGYFSWKRKKHNIANEAALDGFYVIRTNVPEERMSAARRRQNLQETGPGREGVLDDESVRPPSPAHPPPPRAAGPRLPPDLHARILCRKAHARSARLDAVRRRARPDPRLARRQVRAFAAGQAESNHQAHELQTGRPRLPGTARATRNAHDEPDRGASHFSGIRRERRRWSKAGTTL